MAATMDPLRAIRLDQPHTTPLAETDRLRTFTTTDFRQIIHCGAPFTENARLSNFGLRFHFI
jgi:hypothetical protein